MTIGEAFGALRRLTHLCQSGRFYEDHDESTLALREAETAIEALMDAEALGAITILNREFPRG